MSERVAMPALGESVTEGTVTRWLKSVGDTVEVDEPLLEVSTDKVDTEIPSPVAGTLLEILAQEDDTVEVGADLAVVGDASESSGGSDDGGEQQAQEQQEAAQEGQAEEEPAQEEAPQEQEQAEEPAQEQPEQQAPSGGGEVSGGETVTMPALGESVTEGTVTRWLKAEGDQVEVDEPLLEVSTDKVDTEIPSPVAGVLTKILAQEDDTVEVGGELAVIGGEAGGGQSGGGEQHAEEPAEEPAGQPEAEGSAAAAEEPEPEPQPESQAPTEEPEQAGDDGQEEDDLGGIAKEHERAAEESASQGGTKSYHDPGAASGVGTTQQAPSAPPQGGGGQDVSAYVTPLVRKLAAQHNVDLGSLQGTGVGGRIRKQDVLDAAKAAEEQAQAAPAAPAQQAAPAQEPAGRPSGGAAPSPESEAKRGTTEKMSRLRKVIATRMVESLQVSAQLTTVLEVDVTKIARLRQRSKDDFLRREGTKLSFMPFFAQAAVEALKQHPIVNASVEDDTITYHATENLGVAVDTPRGLLVPVIKEAGNLNIAGLAHKIADLAARTRDNKVGPDELSGATFTLTNTGSRGALFDTPIINQPNVAILGTGAVVKRPVVVTDEDGGATIAIRDMVYLALSYDHRVVDGADAARFLVTMKERLEDGNFEV